MEERGRNVEGRRKEEKGGVQGTARGTDEESDEEKREIEEMEEGEMKREGEG